MDDITTSDEEDTWNEYIRRKALAQSQQSQHEQGKKIADYLSQEQQSNSNIDDADAAAEWNTIAIETPQKKYIAQRKVSNANKIYSVVGLKEAVVASGSQGPRDVRYIEEAETKFNIKVNVVDENGNEIQRQLRNQAGNRVVRQVTRYK